MGSTFSLLGKKVCVIDAYGLVYQVFHATNTEMTNVVGEPTGATFGFVRDVFSIIAKLRPDYLICAYDMPEKTFRSRIYPDYKANRSSTPDDLLLQFDFTREFLRGMGTPALGVIGYEADDVMATLAKRVGEMGGSTILVTSDKDARQLINESTSIYLLRKDKYYREGELLEDWGITPEQVVDFQALVGDSSDNVPGVPLIGPKVASELLNKYGTLEGIFQGVVGLKGKRFENIRAYQKQILEISRNLVKLRTDVPVEVDWNAAKLGGIDPERLRRLFQYWNFRSFLGKIDQLAEELGTATAPVSEWFNQIETRRRAFLSDPTLRPVEKDKDGKLVQLSESVSTDVEGSVEFDAKTPLLERFYFSQYGSRSQKSRDNSKKTPDFSDFELVQTHNFPILDSIPLPSFPCSRVKWKRTVVDDKLKLSNLCDRLKSAQVMAISAVTSEIGEQGRVRPRYATLCGLALAYDPNEAFYLPFDAPLGEKTLERKPTLDLLRPFLESDQVAKLGLGLKYDALVLLDSSIRMRGLTFDVEIVDYLARSGETRRELSEIASTYLDCEVFDLKKATSGGKKRLLLNELPTSEVAEYAVDAVLIPFNATPVLRAKLAETPGLVNLATDLEIPLVETLAEMEYNGVAIEPSRFREASAEFLSKQETLEQEIRDLIGVVDSDPTFAQKINLNSPKQLQRLLFDDLGLPVIRKTKTGPSVDAEVLEELATEHPIPEKIVELRKLIKLRGTYLEPLPEQTLKASGRYPIDRVCATFNQTATATGRLSSSDPNLQNIPARSENGKLIRAGFVPDRSQGFDAFLSCDYSQIELRILAHFSGDVELIRAFEEDADIHARVASRIFEVKPEDVTSDMRRKAKAVNFGLIYGQTAFGLSKALKITPSDASSYIDAFFATYPGVSAFFDRVLDDCAQKGYVQTLLGRRRALAGVRGARGRKTLNFPERAAINAVVQGTAADIMKLAMIAVWGRLKREGWLVSHWSLLRDDLEEKEPIAIQGRDFEDAEKNPLFAATIYRETSLPSRRSTVKQNVATDTTRERARLLLQIHDELLFETRREDVDELAKIVVEEMTLGSPLSVPLKIDAEVGDNWGEL